MSSLLHLCSSSKFKLDLQHYNFAICRKRFLQVFNRVQIGSTYESMSVQKNVCPEVQIQAIVQLVQVLLLSFYRCAVTVQFLNRLSFCSREVSKDNYEGEQQRLGGLRLAKSIGVNSYIYDSEVNLNLVHPV